MFNNSMSILLLVLAAHDLMAGELRIGQKVFVKPDAEATIEGTKIKAETIRFPCAVFEIRGEKVLLGRISVQRADVMTADEAAEFFNEQIRKEPEESMHFVNRGRFRGSQGDLDGSLEDFNEALRLDPNNASAFKWRANCWMRKSRLDSAISDATKAVTLDPMDAVAFSFRGYCLAEKGKYDSAIKDANEAISIDPNNDSGYLTRAICKLARVELDGAIEDTTEAIRLEPDNVNALLIRSKCFGLKSEFRAALQDLGEAIKLEPTNARPYLHRGNLRHLMYDIQAAVDDWKTAVKLDPKDSVTCARIGWLRATFHVDQLRDGKEAVEYATKACELTEWKDRFHLSILAAAYAESNDFQKAIAMEEKSLNLSPGTERANRIARVELYRSQMPYREMPKVSLNLTLPGSEKR